MTRCPLSALPNPVWRRTSALDTWGTNAIEGNTLTWREVERLLLNDRTPGDRPVRDVLETVAHEEVFRGLLGRIEEPIRATTALELHGAVFRGVLPDAGTWRRVSVRISGSPQRPPRAEYVAHGMADLEEELAEKELAGDDVFVTASWFHHAFEAVHPFSDGNGRVGRLLVNLYLLRHSWPPVHVLPVDRDGYIDALDAGHSGDLRPLEGLIRVLMGRSLADLLDQVGGAADELRPVKELGKEGPYGAKYLALRASQGELPAVKRKGVWHSSSRIIRAYHELIRGW